jgi:hypothetical protein
MTLDENVEMVRKASERLLARYGGLHGLVRHLQDMDRHRRPSRQRKTSRKPSHQKSVT